MPEIQATGPHASRTASARPLLRVLLLVAEPQQAQLVAELERCLPAVRIELVETLPSARAALLYDGWALIVAQWPHPAAMQLLEEAPDSVTRVLVTDRLGENVLQAAQGLGA